MLEVRPDLAGSLNPKKLLSCPNIFFVPDIREEFSDLEDPFAKSLPLAETAQKMKIKKTAVAKFLIVLSLLDKFSNNDSTIYFEKTKCQGGKKLLSKARSGRSFFVNRRDCQKTASGKRQSFFDEGKNTL